MGAALLYPSAIGSEPAYGLEIAALAARHAGPRGRELHARHRMQSNRHRKATASELDLTFFGASFIADPGGAKVAEADVTSEAVLVHTFDLEAYRRVASSSRCSAIAVRTFMALS